MTIKACFFDIDGTLLDHSSGGGMPESTREALTALQRRGIKVFIATGRAPFMLDQLKALFPFDGFVTLNGSYVTDGNGTVLHTAAHDPEDIRRLLPLARRENLSCMIIEGMESWPAAHDEFNRLMYGFLGQDPPPLYDPVRLAEHPVLQFTAVLMREGVTWPDFVPMEEGVRLLSVLPGVEVTSAGGGILDCIPRGSGKEKGIEAVARHYGFAQEETMVFGDGANDVRMIRWAGIGVAMGNAEETVKAAADHVTAPVWDHGVRKALLHLGVLTRQEL